MGSSIGTREPEMVVEGPASGMVVVGIRSQQPMTVRVLLGEISVETVAETTREVDIL